ncbi:MULTISPECIES: signal peptidase I [unclassified Lysobacter]|uniref:signal peptidase I n=1 Tax=unclassified Lysobacter TaxID=2635362 RepID=UPI001BE9BD14|nr:MULTISPECIES: signal peptidase I [unclassified Lysobacter]MBT2748215.1 signal peptidase I [Lysobacter sp. ISL-42]MBT2753281.1 signal peptidase I [Lysobacter sp. ISL-50]MBT2779006.1 signal peptidase I [Lysobacter sp. ISL-54]MBT2784166.1 signal peptidase I [Lysobacter sp. ISL-52]
MRWFEIALVSLTLFTGLVWLLDKAVLAKRRAAREGLLDDGKEPVVVDYSKAFFPVLFVVLILRSFIAEPFRIPSNSMMPTLLTGDFILVNKFTYGLRLPITNQKILAMGEPERGDVVVFRPPHHPEQDWIKRIIGLPGDKVSYRDGRLTVNGEPIIYAPIGTYQGRGNGTEMTGAQELREQIGKHVHRILLRTESPLLDQGEGDWVVPQGEYFVMGDNRDNSEDSRYWGYLPEQNLRGRAFLIWMNFDGGVDFSRIGNSIP